MKTEAQIRNLLVKKVLEVPANKLKLLSDFFSKIEGIRMNKGEDILSFSGAWKDLDDDAFKDLTDNLNQNRKSQRQPIDE